MSFALFRLDLHTHKTLTILSCTLFNELPSGFSYHKWYHISLCCGGTESRLSTLSRPPSSLFLVFPAALARGSLLRRADGRELASRLCVHHGVRAASIFGFIQIRFIVLVVLLVLFEQLIACPMSYVYFSPNFTRSGRAVEEGNGPTTLCRDNEPLTNAISLQQQERGEFSLETGGKYLSRKVWD